MSVLNPKVPDTPDPVSAERLAYEQFAREHSDPEYRSMFVDLYREWHVFNHKHFGGRLRVAHLAIGRTSPRRLSMCRRTTNYGGMLCITLNEGVAFGTNGHVVRHLGGPGWRRFMGDLLLAETVVQAVRELENDEEEGYDGYGPRFVAHANRIGRELGLPEVVARRRGEDDVGLVPATRWPWGVRPAGYYANDIAVPGSRPRWRGRVPTVFYRAGVFEYFLHLLASESGTDRLRQILGRHVDDDRLLWSPTLRAAERGPKVPPTLDPAWLTWNDACVAKMTDYIARTRSFDALPILADALEDAGCGNVQILEHLRQAASHTGSCWVLQMIRAAARA